MGSPFKEKMFDEKRKEPDAMKLRKLALLDDVERAEIKKLTSEDVDQVHIIMRKTLWESTREQVADVIKNGMSFGAYVQRMLVGAGLAWPAHYGEKQAALTQGEPNALYMEDVALLLAYEGKGIREMLIMEREKLAKERNFQYVVAYISPEWPAGELPLMIKERGNRIEKSYLANGYGFVRSKDGVIAVKRL